MKYLILSLTVCLLLISCSKPESISPYKQTLQAIEQIQQYNKLQTEHITLQIEHELLLNSYKLQQENINNLSAGMSSLKANNDWLETENENLRSEVGFVRKLLTGTTSDKSTIETRYATIFADRDKLSRELTKQKKQYTELIERLTEVNNRTDITTTSNLTKEKRNHFYEMWDLWWETLEANFYHKETNS